MIEAAKKDQLLALIYDYIDQKSNLMALQVRLQQNPNPKVVMQNDFDKVNKLDRDDKDKERKFHEVSIKYRRADREYQEIKKEYEQQATRVEEGFYDIHLQTLRYKSEIKSDIFNVALNEIIQDGYLRKYEGDEEMYDPPISHQQGKPPRQVEKIGFTPIGRVFFIHQGGYKAQEDRLLKERKIQESDRLWNRANILIALLAFLVSYCSYRSSETSKSNSADQQQAIDSLKYQIKQLSAEIKNMPERRSK